MTKNINLSKLILSVLFDAIGMTSFFIPGFGEFSDVIWAPLSYWLMTKMYAGKIGQVSGVINFVEEIAPDLDFIPTFTLTWIYDTFFSKK